MKKIIYKLLVLIILVSCSNNDNNPSIEACSSDNAAVFIDIHIQNYNSYNSVGAYNAGASVQNIYSVDDEGNPFEIGTLNIFIHLEGQSTGIQVFLVAPQPYENTGNYSIIEPLPVEGDGANVIVFQGGSSIELFELGQFTVTLDYLGNFFTTGDATTTIHTATLLSGHFTGVMQNVENAQTYQINGTFCSR